MIRNNIYVYCIYICNIVILLKQMFLWGPTKIKTRKSSVLLQLSQVWGICLALRCLSSPASATLGVSLELSSVVGMRYAWFRGDPSERPVQRVWKNKYLLWSQSLCFHHLETEHNGASTVHGASDPCHSITPCLFCNCCMVVGSLRRADTNTTFGHQQVARLALDGWWNNGIQRFSQKLSWPPWPSKPAVHYAVFPIFRTKWLWQAALASGKG